MKIQLVESHWYQEHDEHLNASSYIVRLVVHWVVGGIYAGRWLLSTDYSDYRLENSFWANFDRTPPNPKRSVS